MRLTKHHGLGNDFLVVLDRAGTEPVGPDAVRHACDRHIGIGADGLIRATAGTDESDLTMHLFNADGGRAEMSGNGIGCLAQAAILGELARVPTVRVSTDAGLRVLEVTASTEPRTHDVTVDMGEAKVGDDEPEWVDDDVIRAVRVDVGNPHLVLHVPDPSWARPIEEIGAAVNELIPGGINVELLTPGPGDGELTMEVFERGVGVTRACGTGAVAVAVAAATWELAGPRARVHMPGGTATIELAETIRYTVPIVHIATIELPWP